MRLLRLVALLLLALPTCHRARPDRPTGAPRDEGWPQAAGPRGTFQLDDAHPPVRWSVARGENVLWRQPLPSAGQGGIAVAGDHLFLTTFDEETAARGLKESNVVLGLALDRASGRRLWSVKLTGDRPSPVLYSFSDATSWTPITDGANVYFFNATGEMGAFTRDGRELWRRRFRGLPEKYPFNRQLEPMLVGDTLITVEPLAPGEPGYRADRDDWNFLRGIDKRTGRTLWIAEDATTHYNTPVVGKLPDGRPAVLHGRGGPHGVPERPVGLTMTSLAPGQEGKTVWRFTPASVPGAPADDGVTYQALYTMVWDARHVYWWKHAPEESHLVIDSATGRLEREQSLIRGVDVRRWDPARGAHVLAANVDLRTLADAPDAPLKPGEVLHVFPGWHANLVVDGYHYFFASSGHHRNGHAPKGHSGPAHCLGRVNVETGKVEYLEVPVAVERAPGSPDRSIYGRRLETRLEDATGRPFAAEDRSHTDGWQIAAFFPTPVALGHKIYLSAQLGVTYVLDARAPVLDERALLAVNDLGAVGETWSLSGPSYADGVLYHRSAKEIVALADRPAPSGGGGARGPILDTHIHLYQVSRPGTPWPTPDQKPLYRDVLPTAYEALARPLGILGSGIVEASNRPEDNRWVLDQVRGNDFFPFFVASLDLGAPDFAAQLDALAADPKVVGVRGFLWSPEITLDAQQLRNLNALAARGMTLDLISRGAKNPKPKVVALARAVPTLRIIIDHLGGAKGPTPDPAWQADMAALAALPNVFMKFSSFFDMYNDTGGESARWNAPDALAAYAPTFDVLMKTFGEDRLVWASNWPVCELGGSLERQIALAEAYLAQQKAGVRDKVMYGNARQFYRRSPPPR